MHRFIFNLSILVTSLAAVSPVAASSNEAALTAWRDAVAEQLDGAIAESAYRQQIASSTSQLQTLGHASTDEATRATEQAIQASEWKELLTKQLASIEEMLAGPKKPADAEGLDIRIPGLPLAAAGQSFAVIHLDSSPRINAIVEEIEILSQELQSLSVSRVRQQQFMSKIQRLQKTAQADPQIADELHLAELQLQAASFAPTDLDEFLQFNLIGLRTTQDAADRSLLTTAIRDWVANSRRLIAVQTARDIAARRDRARRLDKLQQYAAAGAAEIGTLNTSIQNLQHIGQTIRREMTLNKPHLTHIRPVSQQPAGNLGTLMQVTEDRWNQAQARLVAAGRTVIWQSEKVQRLAGALQSYPEFQVEYDAALRRQRLVIAVEDRLATEVRNCETVVRYAMEVYRIDSGRTDDTSQLNQLRSTLFELSADVTARQEETKSRLALAEHRVQALTQLRAKGYASWDELNQSVTEQRVMETQLSRIQLEGQIRSLVDELSKYANSTPAVAESQSGAFE